MFTVVFGSGQCSTTKQTYFAKVTDKAKTRVALDVAGGWPIKYFTDLKELLTVIRDAVRDHQIMHERGVLHRDVSTRNILIRPSPPDSKNSHLSLSELVSKTEGRLIDLDHAKHVEGTMDPGIKPTTGSELLHEAIRRAYDADVTIRALRFVSIHDAFSYCGKAIELNVLGSTPNGKWTLENLGWKDVGAVPDYASHAPIVNERTSTIPFISHQLMGAKYPPVHVPIHDLESFWWVIIYLGLTRESGGGHRRKDETEELSNLVESLFTGTNIGRLKLEYFDRHRGEKIFEKLLEQFSPYFEPLKPMLRRWRDVLMLGYTYEAYEFHLVHKYVLAIIKNELTKLTVKEESSIIRDELRGREKEYTAFICNIDPSNLEGPQPASSIRVGPNSMSPPKSERTPFPLSSPAPVAQINKKTRHIH